MIITNAKSGAINSKIVLPPFLVFQGTVMLLFFGKYSELLKYTR